MEVGTNKRLMVRLLFVFQFLLINVVLNSRRSRSQLALHLLRSMLAALLTHADTAVLRQSRGGVTSQSYTRVVIESIPSRAFAVVVPPGIISGQISRNITHGRCTEGIQHV